MNRDKCPECRQPNGWHASDCTIGLAQVTDQPKPECNCDSGARCYWPNCQHVGSGLGHFP
jgi:hypothetical protein